VAGGGVFLPDSVFCEVSFERVVAVEAASSGGESCGEHHAVVGQCGGWLAMYLAGFFESVEHYFGGDAVVGADVECESGVVIKPGDDLCVLTGGKSEVGEV